MLFCIVTCCITTQSAEGGMKNLEGVGNRKDPTKSASLPRAIPLECIMKFSFSFYRYTMGVYQAYWVQELGVMSPTRASLVSSTLFVMTCVPSPVISILIHKSGRFRPSLMVAMAIPMLTSKNCSINLCRALFPQVLMEKLVFPIVDFDLCWVKLRTPAVICCFFYRNNSKRAEDLLNTVIAA